MKWYDSFTLCVEMSTLNLGNEENGDVRFTAKIKLLCLLNAVGTDGLDDLHSVGFDRDAHGANFDNALQLLRGVFVREESDYVKIDSLYVLNKL